MCAAISNVAVSRLLNSPLLLSVLALPGARVRMPLPSSTNGPASFRGVIGPSWPFVMIWLPVGEGVLVCRSSDGVDARVPPLLFEVIVAVAAARLPGPKGVGMGTGSDVAWESDCAG